MHEAEDALLSVVAKEKLHASFTRPCRPVLADGHFEAAIAELFDRLGCQQHPHFAALQSCVERGYEREDACVCVVMLAERLEVPAERDDVPPGLANPAGVSLRGQRKLGPAPVGEPVA